MSTDTPEFWNDIWSDIDHCGSGSDQILVDQVGLLTPGCALDYGCGTGGNAVWLAKQIRGQVPVIYRSGRLEAELHVPEMTRERLLV